MRDEATSVTTVSSRQASAARRVSPRATQHTHTRAEREKPWDHKVHKRAGCTLAGGESAACTRRSCCGQRARWRFLFFDVDICPLKRSKYPRHFSSPGVRAKPSPRRRHSPRCARGGGTRRRRLVRSPPATHTDAAGRRPLPGALPAPPRVHRDAHPRPREQLGHRDGTSGPPCATPPHREWPQQAVLTRRSGAPARRPTRPPTRRASAASTPPSGAPAGAAVGGAVGGAGAPWRALSVCA